MKKIILGFHRFIFNRGAWQIVGIYFLWQISCLLIIPANYILPNYIFDIISWPCLSLWLIGLIYFGGAWIKISHEQAKINRAKGKSW